MSAVRTVEWALRVIGVGCLGTVLLQTIDARAFQAEQRVAFARAEAAARARREAGRAGAAASEPASGAAAALTPGALVGLLEIPRLRVSTPIVQGDDAATLDRAVGHLPDTPLPWQPGNSAVAAHRDRLFRPLEHIAVGDEIVVRTADAEIRYRVAATSVVSPRDLSVLDPRERDTLTLITCYPFRYVGRAPKRFIVHAERADPVDRSRRRPDSLANHER
jgi:sortase A